MLLEQKYPEVERLEDLVPLSLRIVRFKMTALRRKAARRGEYDAVAVEDIQLPGQDGGPAEYAERRELLERLTRALAKLGPRCRELMRLKIQGHSFPEIARLMGAATLNTVYTWDHRCRQELHRLMGEPR